MKARPPTSVQEAAIGAALFLGPEAAAAWERLQALTGGLDAMDAASFRMLPMVYRNLKASGLSEAALGPLRGVYRQSWYRNRLAISAGVKALAALRAAGIEPAALKGLGLIATAYPEPALRPMHDIDLLFRNDEFRPAVDALLDAGWSPLRGTRADFFRRVKVFHALPLLGPEGVEVDMHRHMLEENCSGGIDDRLFQRLRSGSVSEVAVTTLSPEDHVINACVHGLRWDPVPAWRWLLDAATVVRAAGEQFDWAYLAEECRRRNVSLAVAAGLEMARAYEPAIPEAAVAQVRSVAAGRLERFDFRSQQASDGVFAQGRRYMSRYARLSSGRGPFRKVRDFSTYLECMWELDRPRQVPLDGLRRVTERARGKVPRRRA